MDKDPTLPANESPGTSASPETTRSPGQPATQNRGWTVALAGLGVNLALGILYSWGVFSAALRDAGWTATESQLPYMVACLVFALLMVPGGRLQDRVGPKLALLLAAILTGAGFVLSGVFLTVGGLSLFFGVVFGTAMGFGYAATTPAAIKWFGPHRRGLISGVVVSGFGLAGIYLAPLTTFLIHRFNLRLAFVALGLGFSVLILVFRHFVRNPPADHVPPAAPVTAVARRRTAVARRDFQWKDMIRTPQFAALWLMFFFGTFAGLMIIGKLASIGKEQVGVTPGEAAVFVMLYAIFNWLGRIIFGLVSDRLGRKGTLIAIFVIQTACYALFGLLTTPLLLALGTAWVAFCFGGMLSVFPAATADSFGVRNLGVNYGLVFTAWGFGGVLGPLLGGLVRDWTGSFNISYLVAAGLCLAGTILSFLEKPPVEPETGMPAVRDGAAAPAP